MALVSLIHNLPNFLHVLVAMGSCGVESWRVTRPGWTKDVIAWERHSATQESSFS